MQIPRPAPLLLISPFERQSIFLIDLNELTVMNRYLTSHGFSAGRVDDFSDAPVPLLVQ